MRVNLSRTKTMVINSHMWLQKTDTNVGSSYTLSPLASKTSSSSSLSSQVMMMRFGPERFSLLI